MNISIWLCTAVMYASALAVLPAFAEDQPTTGLVAGGTIMQGEETKPFLRHLHDWNFYYTRDFKSLLGLAEEKKLADIDGLPKILARDIKRIDFIPYTEAEFAAIKKADHSNLINCPGFCRFRKAKVEYLNGKKDNLILYCIMETLSGPERKEPYWLGDLTIHAVIAR